MPRCGRSTSATSTTSRVSTSTDRADRVSEAAWNPLDDGLARRYLVSPVLAAAGLPHVFTTRHFPGVTSPRDPGSPFDAVALDLLGRVGVPATQPAFLRQVHGADVLAAER